MRAEAEGVVGGIAVGELRETRRAYMRYLGQGYEIAVDLPDERSAGALREAFDAAYERLYGRLIPNLDVEVLSWTLTLRGDVEQPVSSAGVERGERAPRLLAGGRVDREALAVGDRVDGAATIVEDQTVVVVPQGFQAEVDAHGNVVVARSASP